MTKKRQFCPRGHDAFLAGRDASKRCLQCKAEDDAAKAALRDQAIAERDAAYERREVERERRLEQEYQAAIRRGGYDAAMARWDRASDETLIATESRYGLCQWEDEVDGQFMGRMCYRRTSDVYCYVHNRQLERESKRREKQKAAEWAPDPPKPRAPREPRPPRRTRSGGSGWAKYKADRPDRAAFYRSGAWTAARSRHLAANLFCVVCGAKANIVDHIRSRAEGGADLDPTNLQSLCSEHHRQKTLAESHRGMKRAAVQRRRTQ